MKVLFFTNIPTPYRVNFFNELGKGCKLTVAYERNSASDRDKRWKSDCANNYKEIFLNQKTLGADLSIGTGLISVIKKESFDIIIFTNYISPSTMIAILYCQAHKIPYYMESDGGFYKKNNPIKAFVKKRLLKPASGFFITCEEYRKYLNSLGVDNKIIYKYPFSSVYEKDIEPLLTNTDKIQIKQSLNIKELKVIIAVGQFIYRKGFDILLKAFSQLDDSSVALYIIGGKITDEYKKLIDKYKISNVFFIDFLSKEELKQYYFAGDLFVMPTREDIWGLVVNEAMARGLSVISSDRCIAGLELVENDWNGYIVQTDNVQELTKRIESVLNNQPKRESMSKNSLEKITYYTIENMAKVHIDFFEIIKGGKK